MIFKDGGYYEGDWNEDARDGFGYCEQPNGEWYRGMFLEGKHHGAGEWQTLNKTIWKGNWKDGVEDGHIIGTTLEGTVIETFF